MITYKPSARAISVLLDGKRVGTIKHTTGPMPIGWQYTPTGVQRGGAIFPRLVDCQRSLEEA